MMFTNKTCLLIVISLTLALSSNAQNSIQSFLHAHNIARAQVGVPVLQWDNNLAAYARNYANSKNGNCLPLKHSGGPYGENLAWGSSDSFSAIDAVNMWVNEKQHYNHGSNSCAAGQVCGHYTQVVWSRTTKLGCARTHCNGGGWYVICSYNPPGNYVGQSPY